MSIFFFFFFFLMDKETCIDHKKQQSCPKVHWEYTKGTKPGEGPKTAGLECQIQVGR